MRLHEICNKLHFNNLKVPGTLVKCIMGHEAGNVYEVVCGKQAGLLSLLEVKSLFGEKSRTLTLGTRRFKKTNIL